MKTVRTVNKSLWWRNPTLSRRQFLNNGITFFGGRVDFQELYLRCKFVALKYIRLWPPFFRMDIALLWYKISPFWIPYHSSLSPRCKWQWFSLTAEGIVLESLADAYTSPKFFTQTAPHSNAFWASEWKDPWMWHGRRKGNSQRWEKWTSADKINVYNKYNIVPQRMTETLYRMATEYREATKITK